MQAAGRVVITSLLSLCFIACSDEGHRNHADTLTVFAAASCAEWVQNLPNGVDLKLQFGPSSGLARQIADGAPAQVFITAHKRWIEYLQGKGRVEGEPVAIARNTLVCVALDSMTFEKGAPTSLADLTRALKADDRIAIADESVPAGDYARQALIHAGQIEHLQPYFVGQDDARSTLRAVTQGQAKVGFVYASDAQLAHVRRLFTLDPATHDPIQYWACVIRKPSPSQTAAMFLAELRSSPVQDLLQRSGFQAENPTDPAPLGQ
ncbi:MAG: molybdate transport system substrate-binding protein [Planctomycetota bacterium]|jgi:molybdate transport system substrate-binding protein